MMEIRDKATIFTAPLLAVRPCLADTVATGHPAKMFLKATPSLWAVSCYFCTGDIAPPPSLPPLRK